MKKITGLEVPDAPWYVAVLCRESESAILHRVACWAIISEEDSDDRVVAMVRCSDGNPELTYFSDGDEAVLGLASPGQELNGDWDDVARERMRHEREAEDNEQRGHDAIKIAALMEPAEIALLRVLSKRSYSTLTRDEVWRVVIDAGAGVLFALVERGLLDTHRGSSSDIRRSWFVTGLGELVLLAVDKSR
jgi:hypothetical protein